MKRQEAKPLDGADEVRSEGPLPPPQGDARPEEGPQSQQEAHGRKRGRRKPKAAAGPDLPFEDNPEPQAQAAPSGEESPAKMSRSKRRRQRRNEAKRLARAEGASEGPPAGEQAANPDKAPVRENRGPDGGNARKNRKPEARKGDFQRKPDEGQRKADDFPRRPEEGQRRQEESRPGEGRRKQGKGQGYEQAQGRQRDDNRKKKSGGDRPRNQDQRRDGGRDRHGFGDERREEFRHRDRPARSFPGEHDPVLPPPEVIAALEGGDFQPPRISRNSPKGKPLPATRVLETLAPSPESIYVLNALEAAIEEAAPLQAKHRAGLRGDVRALWEELTSERESRSADYLGTPPALSAYLRYFLPWNVYRLSSIFSNADFCLPDKAVVADIGSGPLTLPIALYASRPELRDVPLTFYCVDRVERVLEAGQAVFESLCMRVEGRLPPWRIELRKEGFGSPLPERAHLLAAANVFNEFFWKDKRPLGERALETARSLLSSLRENGSLFVMEPGDPRSGAFISALRAAVIAEGASPLGPCPHALSCPMPGIFRYLLPPEETRVAKGDPNAAPSRFVLPNVQMPKKRDKFPWCHFGVDTGKAPAWLLALSEEAGLPKERAVFSYLWAARGIAPRPFGGIPDPVVHSEKERRARAGRGILVRVVSEPFALPEGATGQYACSSLGYTLLRRPRDEQSFEPGDLLEVAASPSQRNDEKSGAIILPT